MRFLACYIILYDKVFLQGEIIMSFLNLEKALSKYGEEPMKGNAQRLQTFDIYHCLLSGSLSVAMKAQDTLGYIPAAFIEWMKLCNGGLLFDTVMLSTKEHDDALDLDFDTFEELNSQEVIDGFALPEGYAVFAMRSYGDPICFNVTAKDGKVYLWDCEAGEFTDIWDSFEDWITEEIDDAVKLIAEDLLEPLEIKLGGDDDN